MTRSYPLTKTERMPRVYYLHTVYFPGGSGSTVTTDTKTGITSTDTVTLGASPPGWKYIISVGRNAGSSLSGRRSRVQGQSGTFSAVWIAGGPGQIPPATVQSSGSYAFTGIMPSPVTTTDGVAENDARSKLLSSYIAARNTWRGGNFLAEVAETIHMLRQPVKHLYNLTRRFTSNVHSIRHIKNASTYRKRLGNYWLSYSFGWKPLFEDIKDANAAIQRLASLSQFDSIPIKGKGKRETATSIVESHGFDAQGISNVQYTKDTVTSYEAKYYGIVRARPGNLSTVRENFGLDGYDFIPAVWEAIPWSFLVDYFVNVQEVLDSMRYASADLGWLMHGVRNTITVKCGDGVFIAPSPLFWSFSGGVSGGRIEATYKTRTVVDTLPYPSFHFKYPKLGSLKWLNVAALLSQIKGSKP